MTPRVSKRGTTGPAGEPPPLSARIPMVGRKAQVEQLKEYLTTPGRHFVFYYAGGGLGKTRLLEQLQELVAQLHEKKGGYRTAGIVDLYHTDIHSNSDVERAIVEGLENQPGQPVGSSYFTGYHTARRRFEYMREIGADPAVLETHRQAISAAFVDGLKEMAVEANKVVLCFDTVELLQYESSIVEERAGLDTVDTRLKHWMLSTLPQLHNVLVVFAGRPKRPTSEKLDLHGRLLADMRQHFRDFEAIELAPLDPDETREFIARISGDQELLPEELVPVVHRLTGGQPIFLHLLGDLVRLSPEPARILERLEDWQGQVGAADSGQSLESAREEFRREVLSGIFNDAGSLGGYVGQIALLPKGIDPDILALTLGLPADEAAGLFEQLRVLSFVKQYVRPSGDSAGGAQLAPPHTERLFLHDEMYALLTVAGAVRHWRKDERQVARVLADDFYSPQLAILEQDLDEETAPEPRAAMRRRLQRLQVERLYYLLVQDPRRGYEEYRRLSDQANRERQMGFGMRLLDEFLRFYNTPERREQFHKAGITEARVTRESALLWVERFHWWGRYDRAVALARQILDAPMELQIPPDDLGILGNVCALWVRGRTLLGGLEPETLQEAEQMLERLGTLPAPSDEERLALARLAASAGYMAIQGGRLDDAAAYSVGANRAFRSLPGHEDELAMLLNNLAYVRALQGRGVIARALAREALEINERIGNRYSTGLTLSTLAQIESMEGNFLEAIQHGEDALEIFEELEDAHGQALALLAIGQSRRKMAKYDIQKGRRVGEARDLLGTAQANLEQALRIAEGASLGGDAATLHAKLGKVYRELGSATEQEEGPRPAIESYRKSEVEFSTALGMPELSRPERLSMLVDYAELLLLYASPKDAEAKLDDLAKEMGNPKAGDGLLAQQVETQDLRPLGKSERLRGIIALRQGRPEEALRHFAQAYACFTSFSPTAHERDRMVELLYDDLRRRPPEEVYALLKSLREWIGGLDQPGQVPEFARTLSDLLGA